MFLRMSRVQFWISPFLLGVVSAIVYKENSHGSYNEPYKGPPGFQRVSSGVVAPYSNENRQLAVNLAALSVGSGTGTGLFYGVPGTGLNFASPVRGGKGGGPGYGIVESGYKRSYSDRGKSGGGRYDYKQGVHVSGGGGGGGGGGGYQDYDKKHHHAATAVRHERHEYHRGTYDGGKVSYGGEKPGYDGHGQGYGYKKYTYGEKRYGYGDRSHGSNPTYIYQPKRQTGYHSDGGADRYGYKKHYDYEKYEHKRNYGGSYKGKGVPYYKPIYTKSHLFH